ncbi:MAG TPA: DUF58 domain-containing protein [Candidatus Latescibacteria bacterium]|nr:DUF58 domain-containing protein [Candidatus Latescibacterota bacterium]
MNVESNRVAAQYRRFLDPQTLARLKGLDLVARFAVEGFMAGLHRSPFHGFSAEFSDHRQYISGDPIRHLDWKVYAKTQRLYLKRYEEDTNLQAYLLLDRSGTMAYGSDGLSKWDYARMVAASLAHLLLSQRDAVGLALFDHDVRRWLPARSTPGHRDALLAEMDRFPAENPTDPSSALHVLAERVRRRSLIILISDMLIPAGAVAPSSGVTLADAMVERWVNSLKHFRHQGHDVLVFHVLHRDEVDFEFSGSVEFAGLEGEPGLLVDTWSVAHIYRQQMSTYLRAVEKACGEIHVDYHRLFTSSPLDLALSSCLDKRRRLG